MRGLWMGVLMLTATHPAFAAECFTFDTTATLQGKVAMIEDYIVLQVTLPICVELPPGDDLGAPAHNVQEVQLVMKDAAAAKKFLGQSVAASGHLSPPHGENNKRPVVLEVEAVKKR